MARDDENLEGSVEVGLQTSPKAKKMKRATEVESTSVNEPVSDSFWRKDFDFQR